MRSLSVQLLALSTALGVCACGGGSELDEYQDGVPSIIPAPIRSSDEIAGDDGNDDDAKPDAGSKPDGGGTGGNSTRKVGDSCTKNSECPGSEPQCATKVSLGFTLTFPGGYCTQLCSNSMCPEGSKCLSFASYSSCLVPCTSNDECRTAEGYTCMAPLFGSKYCLPPTGGLGTGGLLGGGGQ